MTCECPLELAARASADDWPNDNWPHDDNQDDDDIIIVIVLANDQKQDNLRPLRQKWTDDDDHDDREMRDD